MPASVTHLLDDLEARLEQAHAELATLRDENRRLKYRLEQKALAPEPELSAPAAPVAEAIAEGKTIAGRPAEAKEEGIEEVEVNTAATDNPTMPADEPESAHEAPKPEAPSPQALLKQWYVRYPQAFLTDHTSPLKVGIHEDLARHEPWSNKLIRRALAHYVNLPRYVKALREGAPRIDLDGISAGVVDATAAQAAIEKRRRQASNKGPAGKGGAGKERTGKDSTEKPRRPHKPRAAQPETPAGKAQSGAKPQSRETAQPPQSMEDKLASLQHRFGRGDS
ncbi:ProQ/FINO family protein [Vreelandella subglaciescola]|uniref:ProP effector n=1 Tax=Vreelandella subglaciescola TaxID=29571 RepID=A0A1M7FL69_9GAMM|nr:ProQ/FINO family protein [Halomonas subglaciescola]SHM04811.1 ProP effector [Halomonas subglaciescola]